MQSPLKTGLNRCKTKIFCDLMEHKILNFKVLIEQGEDGIYVAKVPDISGCYTHGKTVEQVMGRIKEAIQVCL